MSEHNHDNQKAYSLEDLAALRHSASHLLAAAVLEIYPDAKPTIGPSTDDGFYYDFDFVEPISEKDLQKIEQKMKELVKDWNGFEHRVVDAQEALAIYKNNEYKSELIRELAGENQTLTLYKSGEFEDLCRGGHIDNPKKELRFFKLLSLAGAYWRGSEENKMLTRIYGTAFFSKEELTENLQMREEAKERDHRKIGKDLGLFVFSDTIGKGLPLWTEKGATIRRELERFITDEEIRRGYSHVITPDIANLDLYRKSGHYPYYKDSMYAPIEIDEEEYMLRPMTCPHHFELYSSTPHSYKELPMRIAELAKLYRYERSGELSGLIRVRSFCLADAHIVCTKQQAKAEINGVLDLIEYISSDVFGLEKGKNYSYRLSLGDRSDEKKYFKDDASWDFAEDVLRQVLVERDAAYVEAEGEAAFYGPKIDIQMRNVNGKEDTAFTVQYDFVMPQRFDLKYINEAGEEEQPIVIHRSSIGAIERSIAFLIEHYAGKFPVWLSPTQVSVLPISDKYLEYAGEVANELQRHNVRVHLDERAERLQAKIRHAQLEKIPYMLVVGEKEQADGAVAVRRRDTKEQNVVALKDFVAQVVSEIAQKK
ncbi:MAG: threonine--tRNA ligase [Pseudomonadales bacterium]|nr:threonine--tRNA ligase [Candidatus Woesebacteria bacterium]MCB9801387.1 threonine--tRNA ligase [Pseudomonadales bacterium]